MERLDLTTPVTTPNQTDWKVDELHFEWTAARITVVLKGTNGERLRHVYMGATASSLMTTLNKANLTTNSLHRRVLTQLVSDGVIAGTVAGTPD